MLHYDSVDHYIDSQPEAVQSRLQQLRKAIRSVIPKAEEVISYGMPGYRQDGIVVWYAATQKHIGFYPKPSAVHAFQEQLQSYDLAKGTVRFPLNKELPLALIKDMVRFRAAENKALAEAKKAMLSARKTKV